MADALNPVGNIYEGFWTDHSRAGAWGSTLTLCPTSSVLLTNSLAMWVTLCGIQLWTIIRYILHQRGVSQQLGAPTPHLNGQQVILRNANSALTTAQLMLGWAWTTRRSSGKRSIRAYIIALSAITYTVLFTVAGMFSNNAIGAPLMNGGSAVLLRNNHCGIWNETVYDIVELKDYTNDLEFGMMIEHAGQTANELQRSLEYVQECYYPQVNSSDTTSTCHTLKKPKLETDISSTTACPFNAKMCQQNSNTVVLDTGDIDSHDDFGINAKVEDRVRYRRITKCAVLNGTDYIKGWNGTVMNASSIGQRPEDAYVYFGPAIAQQTDWTYSLANFASFYNEFSVQVTSPYQLAVAQSLAPTDPQYSYNDFEPITELAQDNADINLIFMSFTGMYLGAVHDPWFSANQQYHFDTPLAFLEERYARDSAISTIGCTEQHQFCVNDDDCTGFLGFDQVQNNNTFNNLLTPHQNATFDRVLRAVFYSRLWWVIPNLALTTVPLLASNQAFDGKTGVTVSQTLPDDQWQTELNSWHSISMAQLQRIVVRWATGQVAAQPDFLLKATEPQDVWFCDSLIVPSAIYQSFNVMAIVIIAILGIVIITVGIFIETFASSIRRCIWRSAPKKHWDYDYMLELQRRRNTTRRSSRAFKTSHPHVSMSRSPHEASSSSTMTSVPPKFYGNPHLSPYDSPVSTLVNTRMTSPSPNHHAEFLAPSRAARHSWMTISLHGSDSAIPAMQQNVPKEVDRQARRAFIPFPHPAVTVQYPMTGVRRSPAIPRSPGWI